MRAETYDVLGPFGFLLYFILEAMGWATATTNPLGTARCTPLMAMEQAEFDRTLREEREGW